MTYFIKTSIAVAVTALLSACGGGDDSSSSSSNSGNSNPSTGTTQPSTSTLSASINNHSNNYTWEQTIPLSIQIKDSNNAIINPTGCTADDSTRITVAADCSSVTVHRLGNSSITITVANNQTAKLNVIGVPPKAPLPVSSDGRNIAQRVVTPDNKILTWGTNLSGSFTQLATKDAATIDSIQYPDYVLTSATGGAFDNVYQVAHTRLTAYALTGTGQVYGWGNVESATYPSKKDIVNYPEIVQNPKDTTLLTNIVRIATSSGGFHNLSPYSLGLSDEGKVYEWRDDSLSLSNYPTLLKDNSGNTLSNIRQIAVDDTHGYAVDTQGQVYTWTWNINNTIGSSGFTLVKDSAGNPITGVTKILSGFDNTLALTKAGNVYAWGGEFGGVLGDDKYYLSDAGNSSLYSINFANYVKLNGQPLSGIKDIALGNSIAFGLTNDGYVYSWGDSRYSGLGDGTPMRNAGVTNSTPRLVYDETKQHYLADVVAISASPHSTLALRKNGSMVGWGTGRLTQDTASEYAYPVVIQASKGVPFNLGDLSSYTQMN